MKNIEILYDHYKESDALSKKAQKERDVFFKYLCLSIFFSLIFFIYPNEIIDAANKWLNNKFFITLSITYIIIQTSSWLSIAYFLIQYLHKVIYIERQYKYCNKLEKEIGKKINSKNFNRESNNYLDSYPLILDVLDTFYKWIIPIGIILITSVKIYFEYKSKINNSLFMFDILLYIFIVILIVLYLKMIHFDCDKDI